MSKVLYFKADLLLKSPLAIGSGIDDNTDNDVLTDEKGQPYIPGTALAGICRHYLSEFKSEDEVKEIFGYGNDELKGKKSEIIFYNAYIKEKKETDVLYEISTRDNVRLEDKVSVEGGKFDYEIVEAGSVFGLRIEFYTEDFDEAEDIINKLFNGIAESEIRIGSKTTRGFGRVEIKNEMCLKLELDKQDAMEAYIDFKWDDVKEKYEVISSDNKLYETLILSFELESFIFIRNYATLSVDSNNEDKLVNAEQLLASNPYNVKEKMPVIPGTTWAGVFRHHCLKTLKKVDYANPEKFIDNLFGYVDEKSKNAAISKITFSESLLTNTKALIRTRNAIDRFTGGAGDKKLFTGKPVYSDVGKGKGKGVLEIKLRKGQDESENSLVKNLIDVCIKDLTEGFMTVGGESSVGGGLVTIIESEGWV